MKNISIENAKIGFKNFSGKGGKYNAEGNRNFCVFLDEALAFVLEDDGWNVRWLQPKEEGDAPTPYLSVTVKFGRVSPKIVLVTSKSKTILEEDSISILDWAEIANIDLTVRPYNWEVNGKSGLKAYLKTMYVTIVEDEFEDKYYDVPDSAINTMRSDD